MTRFAIYIPLAMLLLSVTPSTVLAEATYQDFLEQAESHRRSGHFDQAASAYDDAVSKAANTTERALAIAKKGYLYTYGKKDYIEGRRMALKALNMEEAKPVARVTALQVLAACQMQADKDYETAVITLKEALELEGVDWARPSLLIAIGDCYRFNKSYDKAIDAYRQITRMSTADRGIQSVAYLNMGITYQYNLRSNSKARDAYEMAAELQSGLQGEIDGHLSTMNK